MQGERLKMNNTNERKIGSLLSYGQMALNILIGLVYTPVMIHTLGKSEYGLYNTVASTISVIGLLNMGFNNGYIRYYSKYKKNNDMNSIYKLNGLYMIIFVVIGFISLLCGIYIANNLELVFRTGLTIKEYEVAKKLMIIMTINLSISFPMSVFSSIISAHEKFIFLKLVGMIKTVLGPLVVLPLLLIGYRSIMMVIVSTIVAFVADGIFCFYVIYKLKQKFIFGKFQKNLLFDLFFYNSFIAINMLVDQINWNIDKLLLARYKGTFSVAIYAVGYSIYSYYQIFSTSVSGVFTPKIHKLINQYSEQIEIRNEKITELFVMVGRIQFLILGLIAFGFATFGKEFIYYWAGEGYEESYYVAMLLIFPASIALIQNLGIEIQRAQNKHPFRSIIYLIMAFLNLEISIVLCQLYGPIGSAIGTAISLILANGIIMNIYYHKKCGINIILFWRNIGRLFLGMIPSIVLSIIFIKCINFNKIQWLILGIFCYVLIYCFFVWKLSMNEYEHKLITDLLAMIFNKKKEI